MIALDGCWPRHAGLIRRITIQALTSITASAFLTSVIMGLFVGLSARGAPAATELWQIGLSIWAIAPALICPLIAFRMSSLMQDLRTTHEELLYLATMDPLTGLLNRRGFDAVATQAFDAARHSGQPISALMCDIDAFKALNDKYGHDAGDMALRNVAQMIRESVGNRAAVVGRQGGDEFVILLPGVNVEEAAWIAESLRGAFEARALAQQDRAAQCTVSVGTATELSELRTLLRNADAALYRAKRAPRYVLVPAPGPYGHRESTPHILPVVAQAIGQPLLIWLGPLPTKAAPAEKVGQS